MNNNMTKNLFCQSTQNTCFVGYPILLVMFLDWQIPPQKNDGYPLRSSKKRPQDNYELEIVCKV
jgi:hypothetical protein